MSNRFANRLSDLADFHRRCYLEHADMRRVFPGTATVAGGVLSAAQRLGVDVLPVLAAYGMPGGPLRTVDFERLLLRITQGVQHLDVVPDGVILELSGALSSELIDDADSVIIEAVRRGVGDDVPVAIVVGRQANLTENLVKSAWITLDTGPYPLSDPANAGEGALERVVRLIQSGCRPAQVLRRIPARLPLLAQTDEVEPFRTLAREITRFRQSQDVIDIAVAGGFPYQDVPQVGLSIVVSARSDAVARSVAEELASLASTRLGRENAYGVNIEVAVHEAMAATGRPIILADLGDDPLAGAPGDGTAILWALLDLGTPEALLASITDPVAARHATARGRGSRLRVALGALVDRFHGYPIEVEAEVVEIGGDRLRLDGPLDGGLEWQIGQAAVLRMAGRHKGRLDVIVTEHQAPVFDPALFRALGLALDDYQVVALKSSAQYRPALAPLAAGTIDVLTPGISVPDFEYFSFRHELETGA